MPTPRKTHSYPLEYAELFVRATVGPLTIQLQNNEDARRFRERLYAYRRSIEAFEGAANLDKRTSLAVLLAPIARMSIKGPSLTIYYEDTSANDNRSQSAA